MTSCNFDITWNANHVLLQITKQLKCLTLGRDLWHFWSLISYNRRKSFWSAFVVFLRETFLLVESETIFSGATTAASFQHTLSFLSSVMANNYPPHMATGRGGGWCLQGVHDPTDDGRPNVHDRARARQDRLPHPYFCKITSIMVEEVKDWGVGQWWHLPRGLHGRGGQNVGFVFWVQSSPVGIPHFFPAG